MCLNEFSPAVVGNYFNIFLQTFDKYGSLEVFSVSVISPASVFPKKRNSKCLS